MATATVASAVPDYPGVQAVSVTVRATDPRALTVVGLPEPAARELRIRVASSLVNHDDGMRGLGAELAIEPAPATASGLDLAAAVAVLAAHERVPLSSLAGAVFLGELSLTSTVRAVRGVLPMVASVAIKSLEVGRVFVASDNAEEASCGSVARRVYAVRTLGEVVAHLRSEHAMRPYHAPAWEADVCSLPAIPGALSATSQLLIDRPGAGAAMLARRVPWAMPRLTYAEALAASEIHSFAGLLGSGGLLRARPFRAPHCSVSAQAMEGGGRPRRPGEVALARHGVLFLDGLHEFSSAAIEATGRALRAAGDVAPIIIAYAPSCPCGWAPWVGLDADPRRVCRCSEALRTSHVQRLAEFCRQLDIRGPT